MKKTPFSPEFTYAMDSDMTWKKLESACNSQKPITGKVTQITPKSRTITVNLGGGFFSNMPFEEATIYSIYKSDNTLASSILCLLNKRIRVQVTEIKGANIYISRKRNMLNALDYFKEHNKIDYAAIVGFDKLSVFIDIGAGIYGKIMGKDLAPIFYKDPNDLDLHRGDIISVRVLKYIPNKFFFTLSRIFPKAEERLFIGDSVTCKVFDKVQSDPNGIGYYVLVGKAVKGIVDSEFVELNYGDKILAKVKQISKKGPRLEFIKKL